MSEAETREAIQVDRQGQGATGGLPGGSPVASLAVVGEIEPVDDSGREVPQAPASPGGPRAKRKERWVRIEDDEGAYENFQFRMWINYPQPVHEEMTSSDEATARQGLMKIVLEHNGWLDYDGNPYPPASDVGFWTGPRSIPNELLRTVITLIQIEGSRLPNSLIQKQRATNRT